MHKHLDSNEKPTNQTNKKEVQQRQIKARLRPNKKNRKSEMSSPISWASSSIAKVIQT